MQKLPAVDRMWKLVGSGLGSDAVWECEILDARPGATSKGLTLLIAPFVREDVWSSSSSSFSSKINSRRVFKYYCKSIGPSRNPPSLHFPSPCCINKMHTNSKFIQIAWPGI